jgi:hypothetical protein
MYINFHWGDNMELVKEYNISEFRKNATEIIRSIANCGKGVVVTNRKNPQVVVLPSKYDAIANKDVNYSQWLALMFTERFLPDAPPHLKEPQLLELERLPLKKLSALLEVEHLPVNKKLRPRIEKAVGKVILERLEKRHKIADAIQEAETSGLYEAVEHQTGEIDLT